MTSFTKPTADMDLTDTFWIDVHGGTPSLRTIKLVERTIDGRYVAITARTSDGSFSANPTRQTRVSVSTLRKDYRQIDPSEIETPA